MKPGLIVFELRIFWDENRYGACAAILFLYPNVKEKFMRLIFEYRFWFVYLPINLSI